MISHRLTFITPLFNKGSYDDQPEIRPPSIRGQLHWWFRALGGRADDENAIFGSVHSRPVLASKVVVRVSNIIGKTGTPATLPHKRGGRSSDKAAYLPGTTFDLHLIERLGGLDAKLATAFRRTLEAWLLAGTLGLRATRAGGSFAWQPLGENGISMPQDANSYAARLAAVFKDAPMKVMFLNEPFASAEAARCCVSDTLGGRDDYQGENDLAGLNHPLGKILQGRKTSPLRFRIIKLGEVCHIIAAWDNRNAVTGNQPGDLKSIADLLANRGKQIGHVLRAVL